MNIVIPMAGMGKRMRPHTLTIPKPLIPIAGKSIVQRLIEDLVVVINKPINEIAFVIGDFGIEVEKSLLSIAQNIGAKGKIYYQHEPLGTAHAILCADDSLNGEVIVAFADTLFRTSSMIINDADAIIWVKTVDNPSQFGVVTVDNNNLITDFIEKPKNFVSNLAIVGIYYFKNAQILKNELKYLIDNNIRVNGEFQLTDALQSLKNRGLKLKAYTIDEWFDCGNKEATLNTTKRILELTPAENLIMPSAKIINSIIIPPSFIGINAVIENSIVGPYASIGKETYVNNCIIKESIVQRYSIIKNIITSRSIIGNYSEIIGDFKELNVGDYNTLNL